MLALYSDMDRTATIGAIPAGGTYNLELFYVKGDGPFIGVACEFRLSLSTEGAAFLDPVWSEEVEVTLGSIAGGIALTGDGTCLGSVPYGEYNEIVHIGSIPVINLSESDPFTVSVEGWSGDLPLITACAAGHPIHEVQGGQFLFNVFLAVTKAEATSPLSVAVHFSAEVTPQTAEDAANYRIIQTTDPAGALSILNAALSSDPTVVLLTLGDPLSPNLAYSLQAENVEDLQGHKVAMPGPVDITLIDWIAPSLNMASVLSGTSLELIFSEPMESAAANETSNYTVFETFSPQSLVAISGAQLQQGGTHLILSLGDSLTVGASYTVRVDNLKDIASNFIGPAHKFTFIMPDVYPPRIAGISVMSTTVLEVAFSEPLDSLSAVNKNHYAVRKASNSSAVLIAGAVLLNDKITVRLSLTIWRPAMRSGNGPETRPPTARPSWRALMVPK